VKAIVIENDGEIGLHDSVEGGASVHILWPLDTKVEGLVSKKAETKILPLPKLNILVVDDDPLVRSTITKLIEELGLTATSLESPLQALDILKQGDDFDLIITDFIMPEMNGAEFIERLRESGDSRPIILMSGYDDYEELTNKVEYLPATRIQKPFTLDQLRELLAGAPT
jgi:hypothetical protein